MQLSALFSLSLYIVLWIPWFGMWVNELTCSVLTLGFQRTSLSSLIKNSWFVCRSVWFVCHNHLPLLWGRFVRSKFWIQNELVVVDSDWTVEYYMLCFSNIEFFWMCGYLVWFPISAFLEYYSVLFWMIFGSVTLLWTYSEEVWSHWSAEVKCDHSLINYSSSRHFYSRCVSSCHFVCNCSLRLYCTVKCTKLVNWLWRYKHHLIWRSVYFVIHRYCLFVESAKHTPSLRR